MKRTLLLCEIERLTRRFISRHPRKSLAAFLVLIRAIQESATNDKKRIPLISLTSVGDSKSESTMHLHKALIDFGAKITKYRNREVVDFDTTPSGTYYIEINSDDFLTTTSEFEQERVGFLLDILESLRKTNRLVSPTIVLYCIAVFFQKIHDSVLIAKYVDIYPENKHSRAHTRNLHILGDKGLIMMIKNGDNKNSSFIVVPVGG